MQEAFVRLATQEPVPDNPAAWLLRVVRNEAISQLRSQQRRRHREIAAAQTRSRWFEPPPFSDHALASGEVEEALSSLERETRDVLVAHLWGGMTFRDIAEAFDTSRAGAHRAYQQGIRKLQQAFQSEVDPSLRKSV